MHTHMGVKIEEWEDGQVNIGIAVCPQKNGARSIVPSANLEGQDTPQSSLLSNANTQNFIVPKSAFVIRPPENYQSQGGINITYAHNQTGNSDLIIMLNPQDQGQQEKLSYIQQQIQHQYLSTDLAPEKGPKINRKREEKTKENEVDREELVHAMNKVEEVQELIPVLARGEIEEVKGSKFVGASGDRNQNMDKIEENQGNSNIPREEGSCNRTSPQEALNNLEKKGIEEEEGSPKENLLQKKSGSSMKRVSWVEDCETFAEESNNGILRSSRNNSKENKRESVRKSNGTRNNSSNGGGDSGTSNQSSPMKKHQNGYNSPPDDTASVEGYTTTAAGGGNRMSGDKSRIPVIATNGDYQPTCDYYRRKMLRECMCNNSPPTLADNWYGYTSLQRYAGQKVVKKIAAEQKRLEEDISNRRKTEIWILGNDMDDFLVTSPAVPLRKKTTRLKPMQIVQ